MALSSWDSQATIEELSLPPLGPSTPASADQEKLSGPSGSAKQQGANTVLPSFTRLSELVSSATDVLNVAVEEYCGATARVLDHVFPLSPDAQLALRRLAAKASVEAPASPSKTTLSSLPSTSSLAQAADVDPSSPASPSSAASNSGRSVASGSVQSIQDSSYVDDNISFYTAPDVPDHRMELKVLILSLLVRAGEVVDGTVGWDKLEPLVPRLRLLASNPLLGYVLPPVVRTALVDELTRWHRELVNSKKKRQD